MNKYHILDVYAYLNTVKAIPKFANLESRGVPVGGMHFLLRKITSELIVGNYIGLAFDGKSPSNPKLEGYKANRKKDPSIIVQANFLYDMLRKCGVPCYRGFGEADDHIYGLCEWAYPNVGNLTPIFVNSADYDLCHNVDSAGVEFKTINSNSLNVNSATFHLIPFDKKHKEPVIYNTISAYKVFCGDSSDSIKTFTSSNGVKGIDLYRGFKKMISDYGGAVGRVTRDRSLLDSYIEYVIKDPKDLAILKKRANAIFPKDLSAQVGGYEMRNSNQIDLQVLANYCKAIKDFTSVSNLRKVGVYSDESPKYGDEIYQLGLEYKSGVYHADNNLPMASLDTFSEKLSVVKGF